VRSGELFRLSLARLQSCSPSREEFAVAQALYNGTDLHRGGFLRLVFCMLCRYDALCGPGKDEGQGLQAAVPETVLEALTTHLDPGAPWPPPLPVECYASPLNCRAVDAFAPGLFGSLCADVDVFFGSVGPFLGSELSLTRGLYEVNPPFDLGVMQRCSERLLQLLHESESLGGSLCFAVIMPEWQTPWTHTAVGTQSKESTPLALLLQSRFCRGSLVVRGRRHSYVHGLSHLRGEPGDRHMLSMAKSRCIILQTTRRFEFSPPTEQLWLALKAAWRGDGARSVDT